MTENIILENEYFKFFMINNNVYIHTQPKEQQEYYEPDEIMSQEEKMKRVNDMLEYFYNFWKVVEKRGDSNYRVYFIL